VTTYTSEALQDVKFTYIWSERKCHKLYTELYNVALSALSKELLNKNLVQVHFLHQWGCFLNTMYFKNHLTEIKKKKGMDVWLWGQYVCQISSQS
jgi:hypothetical protein